MSDLTDELLMLRRPATSDQPGKSVRTHVTHGTVSEAALVVAATDDPPAGACACSTQVASVPADSATRLEAVAVIASRQPAVNGAAAGLLPRQSSHSVTIHRSRMRRSPIDLAGTLPKRHETHNLLLT